MEARENQMFKVDGIGITVISCWQKFVLRKENKGDLWQSGRKHNNQWLHSCIIMY